MISANSVYGACGSSKGLLQCREVAEATTAAGRDIITFTKRIIENEFRIPGCEVVYGDTDSAFVRLPSEHRKAQESDIFALGTEMATLVTDCFRKSLDTDIRNHCVVALEMEKFLRPLILYKKKRYVGVAYEEEGKEGKMLVKGIELVRRDAVPLVRETQREVIDALLIQQSPIKAVAAVRNAAEKVIQLAPGGPFDAVLLSKSLRQTYANPDGMPHVKVKELMHRRDAGSAPRVGDRVEYVVIASESSRVVDRVEDIGHARRCNLPPDWLFYISSRWKHVVRHRYSETFQT